MSEVEVPEAAIEALNAAVPGHGVRWIPSPTDEPAGWVCRCSHEGKTFAERQDHQQRALLAAAAPHIAAAALRLAAEELRDRLGGDLGGDLISRVHIAWLRHRADEVDGRQPTPDTREGILAAAGLTEADMADG